jgi:hypothetical protein
MTSCSCSPTPLPSQTRLWTCRGAYLSAGILSEWSAADALHVAIATLAGCERLVSWNFKHLVHADKAPRYAAVNTLRGYPPISIYFPREVVLYEEDV